MYTYRTGSEVSIKQKTDWIQRLRSGQVPRDWICMFQWFGLRVVQWHCSLTVRRFLGQIGHH